MLLGLAALAFPVVARLPAGAFVGWLLLAAGLLELAAAFVFAGTGRTGAGAAAAATTIAGALFLANPSIKLVPGVWIVTIWLALRGAILLVTGFRTRGEVRPLGLYAGACDLLLALALLLGMPVSAIVLLLFGPSPEMRAGFAVVLTASFFVTGASLIAIARSRLR
ncbi:hypothetical protein C7I55_15540 [Sphingomonas deserti]|uniref:HdeD family acid-resistance protein n=2 Tax=Allosphingosinicella deserti TaxID=2116704 RepID=A0A2P7QLB3_9SPHN|nr:hypothetical protein C7I55_15540 [Sphingomonas deserti]